MASGEPEPQSVLTYVIVYICLLVMVALAVWLAFVDFGRYINNGIALGLACIKATLIILIFMHVRFQPWLTWFFAAAGFIWMSIMLVLTGSDYMTRNHPPDMSTKGEPIYLAPVPPNSPGPEFAPR